MIGIKSMMTQINQIILGYSKYMYVVIQIVNI